MLPRNMDQTCNFTIYQIGNTFITNFVQLITNHSNLDYKKSFQQTKKREMTMGRQIWLVNFDILFFSKNI